MGIVKLDLIVVSLNTDSKHMLIVCLQMIIY